MKQSKPEKAFQRGANEQIKRREDDGRGGRMPKEGQPLDIPNSLKRGSGLPTKDGVDGRRQ